MSVSRLTSSSWRVPSGACPPNTVPSTVKATSRVAADQHRDGVAHPRPRGLALGDRVDQPGEVQVGEHQVGGGAAAGDSAPETPTPTSASRMAAASFTPSSVIARVAPTAGGPPRATPSAPGEPGEHPRRPHQLGPLGVRRPRQLRAGDHPVGVGDAGLGGDGAAVSGWSPVATTTRTPAARSCSTAATDDFRSVSARPISPRRVSSRAAPSRSSGRSTARSATASTRSPSPARSCTRCWILRA